jgi:APA family basic amino acid/polyamine antiporter
MALWGHSAARWLAIMLALSIAGGVSAMMWAGPRVYWAMARDGVVAPWLAAHHAGSGAPVRAILLQSAWASILVVTGTFEQLVVYSGVVLAMFMVWILGSLIRLRGRIPESPRPYCAPLYPWLPSGLMLGALGVVGNSLLFRPVESLLGLMTVLAGLPLYWWWNRGDAAT